MIISKVEATGYRCLRDVKQELQPYQILVGPNGSGKSVFLDVIAFLGDLVSGDLKEAVAKRTENFYDLVWGRTGRSFGLTIEARSPQENDRTTHPSAGLIRWEVEATIDANDDEIAISSERLTVSDASGNQVPLFVSDGTKFSFAGELGLGGRLLLSLHREHSSLFALGNLGIDEIDFRVVSLFNLLRNGVQTVALDDDSLRAPNPPGTGRSAVYNGSNLARLVAHLRDSSVDVFGSWLEHVRTAIPDIASIRIVDRPEDRHRYLMVQYAGGLDSSSTLCEERGL